MSSRSVVALVCATVTACSLVTSLDGYTGGVPTKDGGPEASTIRDAAASDAPVGDARAPDPSDGGPGCDDPGLVAYWPMDEGTGTSTVDCKGGLVASFNGPDASVAWTTRGTGGAVQFSGTDGQLLIGVRQELDLTGPITVAGWFRYETNPGSYVGVVWNFSGSNGYELVMNGSGQMYSNYGDGNANKGLMFPAISTGTWHHVASVLEPSVRMELFLDGASVTKSTTGVPAQVAVYAGGSKRMGTVFSPTSWSGALDDVRVYARALAPDEIAALAQK